MQRGPSGESNDGRLRLERYRHPGLRHSRSPPPAEIAYWKGPAPRTAFLPGSGSWSPGVDRTVEKQAGLARFVKARAADGKGHELNLWIVGDAGGFQVLRFTDDFLRTHLGKSIHADALKGD